MLRGLLKGRLGKHTRFGLRDTEAIDRNNATRVGHRIRKQSQMVVVHRLLREDLVELLEQRKTRRLNSEDIHDLVNVVRSAAGVIDTRENRKLLEIGTLHIQYLERLTDLATHATIADQLIFDFAEIETTHARISGHDHLQKSLLDATTNGLNADLIGRQELEANRQFTLGIDEGAGNLHLLRKLGSQLLRLQTSLNLRHVQHTATNELRGIQLHTNHPRTANTVGLHREPLLVLQDFTILLQDRLARSHRILVDPHGLRDFTERRLLDLAHLVNGSLLRVLDVRLQLQSIARALRVLGGIQEFLNTRDTRRRIRLGRTCRVEGIERKLSGGLTDGLCGKCTDHLAGMNLSLDVAEANVTEEFRKEHLGQTMNHDGLLRSQVEAKESMEQAIARELVLELGELRNHLRRREIRLGGLRVAVLLKESRHMNGSQNHIITLLATERTPHDHFAILEDFLQEIRRLRHGLRELGIDVLGRECELLVELLQGHRDRRIRLLLNGSRLNTVLTLGNLHDRSTDRTNRAVLRDMEILHGLDQATLNVTGIRRLDSRINETFTTCLCMEEELRGHETAHEAVLNKPTTLQTIIKLGEVRKRTLLKRLLNATTLNQLLTEQSHHLLHVETTALGTRLNHLHNAVVLGKLRVHVLRDLIGHRLHQRVDLVFELFAIRTTRIIAELSGMNALEKLVDLATRFRNGFIDELISGNIRHEVTRTDREARLQVVLRDNRLHVVDELGGCLGVHVIEDGVNRRRGCTLLERTLDELTVFHDGTRSLEAHERECHGDELGTRELTLRNRTTNASQDIESDVLGNDDVGLRDAIGARHRILEELDDGRVGTRANDLANHARELTKLRSSRDALRDVHVHLVTVEVRILRTRRRNVEAERRLRKHTHAVSFHGSLVERRLAVEEHDVAVDEVTMNDVTLAKLNVLRIDLAKIHGAIFLGELDGLGTRMLLGTIANLLHEAFAILQCDTLGEREIRRNLRRNTEFIQLNVGIGRDHRTSREVDTLTHEVATNTTLLGTHAGLEGTERATRTLDGRVETLDIVIHLRRHILLKEHRALRENIGRLTLVHLVTQTVVGANDHEQLVRQVILHTLVVVHDDRWTDAKRRHCEDRADHPVRASKLRIESELTALLIRQALEGTQNDLRLERNGFTLLAFSLKSTCRTIDLGDVLEDLGLALGTETGLGANLRVAWQNFAAVQADLIGELVNHVLELNELHRSCHTNVTEMPGALQIRVAARRADLSILGGTKARIKDAARNRLISLVVFVCGDLDDTLLENIVGAPDAELDADDLVAHLTAVLFLSFRRFVFAASARTGEFPNRS